jgi:hypothetical protein
MRASGADPTVVLPLTDLSGEPEYRGTVRGGEIRSASSVLPRSRSHGALAWPATRLTVAAPMDQSDSQGLVVTVLSAKAARNTARQCFRMR